MVQGGDDEQIHLKSLFSTAADLPVGHPLRDFQKQHLYNLEMAALEAFSEGTDLPGGLISKLGLTPAKMEQLAKIRGERKWQEFLFQVIFQRIIDRIDALMDHHLREIDRILTTIEKVLGDLEVLDNDHAALDMVIENYRSSGILSLDSPARRAIEAYTQRSGHVIIEPNYKDILIIQDDVEVQQEQLRQDLHTHRQEFEFHQKRVEQLCSLKENLSSQGNDKLTENFTILEGYERLRMPPAQQNSAQSEDEYKLHQGTPLISEDLQQTRGDTTFAFDFSALEKETTKKPTDSHLTKEPGHFSTTKSSHLKP